MVQPNILRNCIDKPGSTDINFPPIIYTLEYDLYTRPNHIWLDISGVLSLVIAWLRTFQNSILLMYKLIVSSQLKHKCVVLGCSGNLFLLPLSLQTVAQISSHSAMSELLLTLKLPRGHCAPVVNIHSPRFPP